MLRDPDKLRIFRVKVNDDGKKLLEQAVLNRLIQDGQPVDVNNADMQSIQGDCLVRICEEWISSLSSMEDPQLARARK